MRSAPVNVADSTTVVSEMGELWSPKIAPEKITPTMTATRVWPSAPPPVISQAMGTAMGVMIPIVPQEVPVEKAMKPATTITSAGRTAAGTVPTVASATYWPVPSAEMTSPIPTRARGLTPR